MRDLRQLKIKDKNFVNCLNNIKGKVEGFWNNYILLKHSTKYNVSHSERIIEIPRKLVDDYPNLLGERELFILLASAYLHDIDMQLPRHAGLPEKIEYTIEEPEVVRERHNESSAEMVLESISPKSNFSLKLENCKEYTDLVATLCRYHRKLDINELEEASISGEIAWITC